MIDGIPLWCLVAVFAVCRFLIWITWPLEGDDDNKD